MSYDNYVMLLDTGHWTFEVKLASIHLATYAGLGIRLLRQPKLPNGGGALMLLVRIV